MDVEGLIIGLLLFSGFIIAFGLIHADLQNPATYAITPETDKNWTSYNRFTEMKELSVELSQEIKTNQTFLAGVDDLIGAVKVGFSSIRLIFKSVETVKVLGKETTDLLKIPTEFYLILISIVLIGISFAVISAIMRYRM